MEPRVSALETDMKDVKSALGCMEPMLARIDERLGHVATKAELTEVTGSVRVVSSDVTALDSRVAKVETAVNDTVKPALSKSIGPAQAVSMRAGAIMILIAAVEAIKWLKAHGYIPHSP